jgi:acetoin utilization protein AcuB
MKIADVMTRDPCCVQCDEPLREAHRLMRALGVRHLPVLDGDRLVGLLSQRDLYLLETVRTVDPGIELVSRAMTERPFAVAPTASVREVVGEMREKRHGSAIVVDKERVTGIFTRADALRALEELLE